MPPSIAKRCYVSGRVQGVFYRASTRKKAKELGVFGYACNLPDGRVEVLAVGDATRVDALAAWLWEGSAGSQVATVEVHEVDMSQLNEPPDDFVTR